MLSCAFRALAILISIFLQSGYSQNIQKSKSLHIKPLDNSLTFFPSSKHSEEVTKDILVFTFNQKKKASKSHSHRRLVKGPKDDPPFITITQVNTFAQFLFCHNLTIDC